MKIKKASIIFHIISVVLCICLLFCLTSCSKKATDKSREEVKPQKTLADFNFSDMQGMKIWVAIENYDFNEGTIKIFTNSGKINGRHFLNIGAEYVTDLRFGTINFEDDYFYYSAVDYYGEPQDIILDTVNYTKTSDDSISNGYCAMVMRTNFDVDKNYLVIELHDGSSTDLYVPIDLIDWYSGEYANYSITYNFK